MTHLCYKSGMGFRVFALFLTAFSSFSIPSLALACAGHFGMIYSAGPLNLRNLGGRIEASSDWLIYKTNESNAFGPLEAHLRRDPEGVSMLVGNGIPTDGAVQGALLRSRLGHFWDVDAKRESYSLGLYDKGSERMVGIGEITRDGEQLTIAYYIFQNMRRNGYATEAAKGLHDLAWLTFGKIPVSAYVLPGNVGSIAVLKKLEFEETPSDRPGWYRFADVNYWE